MERTPLVNQASTSRPGQWYRPIIGVGVERTPLVNQATTSRTVQCTLFIYRPIIRA